MFSYHQIKKEQKNMKQTAGDTNEFKSQAIQIVEFTFQRWKLNKREKKL